LNGRSSREQSRSAEGVQEHWQRRLLRTRRERPRGRRAAEQPDERAAFSLDHLVGERNQQTTYRTGRAFDHVFRTDEQSERISMPSFAVLQTNARADPLF
jgi:hypothetical protein